jgi:hypothetical protein
LALSILFSGWPDSVWVSHARNIGHPLCRVKWR